MQFVVSYRSPLIWPDANAIAGACRKAGIRFCVGVANGWSARDLAEWLVGPYRTVAQRHGERLVDPGAFKATLLPWPAWPARIAEVMIGAREEVMNALLEAVDRGKDASFARDALRRGAVSPMETKSGEPAWAPVDKLRMKLGDRVLSLFAVDYLVNPEDYTGDLLA